MPKQVQLRLYVQVLTWVFERCNPAERREEVIKNLFDQYRSWDGWLGGKAVGFSNPTAKQRLAALPKDNAANRQRAIVRWFLSFFPGLGRDPIRERINAGESALLIVEEYVARYQAMISPARPKRSVGRPRGSVHRLPVVEASKEPARVPFLSLHEASERRNAFRIVRELARAHDESGALERMLSELEEKVSGGVGSTALKKVA